MAVYAGDEEVNDDEVPLVSYEEVSATVALRLMRHDAAAEAQ